MLDLFKKNSQDDEPKNSEQADNTPSDPLAILEKLSEEEAMLLNEKTALLDTEEKLWHKVNEAIQTKKQRIEQLKSEIPELKQRCESLAKILEIPVYKESSA
jgi:predicted enzyme involved in methoxymalonyl-ACP biosynthesis